MWRFNPLLLRLLGGISLSLLCSHSSRGSALDLDPPLHVGRLRASVLRSDRTGLKAQVLGGSGSLRPGRLRASVLRSDRRGLKEQLLPGLWLTQAGGGSGTEEAGRACGVRGVMTLQQPEAHHAFSRGSCPRLTGAWRWRAAQAPGRGGVESDLCSHTGFSVAAAAALASHARLWGPC